MRSDNNSTATPPLQFLPGSVSSVCVTGVALPGGLLTGYLMDFARQMFANPTNLVQEQLRPYVWSKVDTESKIFIDSVTRWAPQIVGQRPAILVKRNSLQIQRITIGNQYHGVANVVRGSAVDTNPRYEVLLQGAWTLFVVGKTGTEVEAIGTELMLRLIEFSPAIAKELGLHRVAPMDIGAVNKLEESEEHWVLPVPVAVAFTHGWRLVQQAPLVQALTVNV